MMDMMGELRALRRMIQGGALRGKVVGALAGARAMLQVAQRAGETKGRVQLLLPPGFYAIPVAGADVLTFAVGGGADHQVAVGGNLLSHAVLDLATGELALSNAAGGAQRIALRLAKIELVNTTQINVDSPVVQIGPHGSAFHQLIDQRFQALFNSHSHGGGAPPDQTLGSAHMTSATVAS